MKKYSKSVLKFKKLYIFLISIFIVLFVIGILLLVCFCFNDRIEVDKQRNDAMNVSDDVAVNSTPIIIDNLVVGATYILDGLVLINIILKVIIKMIVR